MLHACLARVCLAGLRHAVVRRGASVVMVVVLMLRLLRAGHIASERQVRQLGARPRPRVRRHLRTIALHKMQSVSGCMLRKQRLHGAP
jgi:hypothetical protein